MGHRHLPNTSQTFEIDQDQNQCHGAVEGSYLPIGRAVAPENGSYAYPTEHRVSNGGYDASQQDFEGRLVEHSSSGFRLEGRYMQPAVSGTSYDPFPHFPTARSINIAPENNAGHGHPNFHNWSTTINEMEGGSLAPTMGIVRGPYKRKSPDNSVACERGDTSRFYAAGSSSSSEFQQDKPTVDHQTYCSGSNGLPHYWSGSVSIGNEDFQRNVRSRSRFDLEPNTWRSYPSTYSSYPHCPMTQPRSRPQTADIPNLNGNASVHEPNHNTMFPAAHGRLQTSEYSGMNHETNQFFAGGNTTEIGGHCHGPILSRNPVLPPQYPHAPHPQAVRGSGINYSRGAIPPYTADPCFARLGNEASSSENRLQMPSESYSSQPSRPLPARGWHSNHRDSRSRRYHRSSIAVDGRDRMRSEASMMVDRSSLYGSQNRFDEYRDMRLDVDNMSYEELLALGERIGSVSTGLSEEVVPKCLMVKTYCSSDCNMEDASCAICLEKYENGEEIGTVRNCGHDYHVGCVKRWLSMKNVCPICKGCAQADGSEDN